MMYYKRIAKVLALHLFLICSIPHVHALFDIGSWMGVSSLPQGKMSFSFLSSIESRRTQLDELQKKLSEEEVTARETEKQLADEINKVSASIDKMKEDLKDASDDQKEYLNKHVSLLSDRKQELVAAKELPEETLKILRQHIKLVSSIIDRLDKEYEALQGRKERRKLVYVLSEAEEAQSKIAELDGRVSSGATKKETLQKEKDAEKENLVLLEKQYQNKSKEQEKLRGRQQELSLLQEELHLLQDKKTHSNLKIAKLRLEIAYKSDEIKFHTYKLEELRNELPSILKKLTLSDKDVKEAKEKLQVTKEKASKIKEDLAKQRELKRNEKEKYLLELNELKLERLQLKEKGEGETPQRYQLETKIDKLQTRIEHHESVIDILNAQRDLQDVKVKREEQQTAIIEVRRRLEVLSERQQKLRPVGLTDEEAQDQGRIEEWLPKFFNQKNFAINAIKILTERRNEAIDLSSKRSRALESLRTKRQRIQEKKVFFKDSGKAYREVLSNLDDAAGFVHSQQQLTQQYLTINSELIHLHNEIVDQSEFIIAELEARKISLSIWKRSPKAISFAGLKQSLLDAERFIVKFFWETSQHLSPLNIVRTFRQFEMHDYLVIFLYLFLYILLFFLVRKAFILLKNYLDAYIRSGQGGFGLYLSIFRSLVIFFIERFGIIFTWLYIFITLQIRGRFLPLPLYYLTAPYYSALFYLVSIPIFVYIARHLLITFKTLNQKLSFLFFTEKFQDKFIFLITISLYASAVAIPLRQAFLSNSDVVSDFPAVILAAYSLILVVVLLFFFNKEDVLKLIPSQSGFFIWLKKKIDKYYYPVFTFFMGLLILSNPYIGYSNLAWYLAFAVPASALLIYGMFFVHNELRKYAAFFFIKEEEDQVIDKFEHARTYYGFFIIVAFLFLLGGTFVLVARIWGFKYTLYTLWKALADDWVIHDVVYAGTKLGVVQLLTVVLFLVSGFVVSTLLSKFVLNKLFDIFRTEPGTQNTISRILHYIIIFFSLVLGFTAIKLGTLVNWVMTGLFFGLIFGLKDLVSDFFAGFWVLVERPVEIGHFIQTGELRGTVQKIAVRATTVRTAQNYSVVVPNRELVSKPIINWGGGRYAVGFEITIVVNYGADTKMVVTILRETIQKHPLVLRVPNIVIRLDDLTDVGMQFFARAFISSRRVRDQWDIASEIRMEVIQVLSDHDISIPYPHRIIHNAGSTGEITGAYSYPQEDDDETEQPEAETNEEKDQNANSSV